MWAYNYTDELYHHGVKGMKWGVRKDRPIISGKEYGHALHELMTNMTLEERGKQFVSKYIGDHLYEFEKKSEGVYEVIGKEKIKSLINYEGENSRWK